MGSRGAKTDSFLALKKYQYEGRKGGREGGREGGKVECFCSISSSSSFSSSCNFYFSPAAGNDDGTAAPDIMERFDNVLKMLEENGEL